jgi:hypothetical protein
MQFLGDGCAVDCGPRFGLFFVNDANANFCRFHDASLVSIITPCGTSFITIPLQFELQ